LSIKKVESGKNQFRIILQIYILDFREKSLPKVTEARITKKLGKNSGKTTATGKPGQDSEKQPG
jgi:hypothetical protein